MSFADAVDLRQHLASLLAPYLGEWENGTPRIHISPPTSKLSPRDKETATTDSEVECIVQRVHDSKPRSMSGGQRYEEPVYTARFVNYGDDTKLTQIRNILDRDSLIIQARPPTYIEASLDVYEQMNIYVKTARVLNTVVHIPT